MRVGFQVFILSLMTFLGWFLLSLVCCYTRVELWYPRPIYHYHGDFDGAYYVGGGDMYEYPHLRGPPVDSHLPVPHDLLREMHD